MTRANKIMKQVETFQKWIKFRGKAIEICTNPNSKEFGSMYPYIKFIADNRDKKVWAWDGYDGPLHDPLWLMTKETRLKSDIESGHVLAGYAKMSNKSSKPVMDDGDGDATTEKYFVKHDLDKIAKQFAWVNKYIEVDSFIRNYGKQNFA